MRERAATSIVNAAPIFGSPSVTSLPTDCSAVPDRIPLTCIMDLESCAINLLKYHEYRVSDLAPRAWPLGSDRKPSNASFR
jgi:hypothetical protein